MTIISPFSKNLNDFCIVKTVMVTNGQLPRSLNGAVRKNETMTCFLSPNTVG